MIDSYDVTISEQALTDLTGIYKHIAEVLLEPIIAEKQYTRIENAIYSLDQMPERYRRYDIEPWKSRNLRVMPVNNYLVFYVVDNTNKYVTAIRIMYGARDIEHELNNTAWPCD